MRSFAAWVLPLALCVSMAASEPAHIVPGDNLLVEGISPIPASLADAVQRYTEFRSASLSSWHPTRREMLIGTRFGNSSQVHHVKMPGGARTQLTFLKEPARGASYQPKTGDCFIFAMDTAGNEFYQYYRHDLITGHITLLTDGKSRNSGGTWSADGRWFAYGSTRRTGKDVDIYLLNPADPASDRCIVELTGGGWRIQDFSPDGQTLLVSEFMSVNESHLWLVDIATGRRTRLTPKDDTAKIAYDSAMFARNGRGIYVTTDRESEFMRLVQLDPATGKQAVLTGNIPWDVEQFALSHDGRNIALVTNEEGVARLRLLDAASGQEKPLPSLPPGLIGGLEWHQNNADLGFTFVSARSTADVYSINVQTGQLDRWTSSETGGLNPETFAEPSLVRWPAFDGRSLSGFLYLPPPRFTGKRPVLISIHGGPEGQARPGFLNRRNYFINELGVALLYPNIRGSSGYGKTFLQLDNGLLREDSYKDIGSLLDWIKTQPNLDADRIMVTGGSYGGHMTFAVASLYSDRIRAALPVVGMSNLVTFLERTEGYRRDLRRVEYGDERDPQMRAFLQRIAPLNNAQKIKVPMFIVQGANDPRVPASEAEQMVRVVRGNGTPVWYLLARDEGHGFAKKGNQDYLFYATILFIQQHLLN